MKNGLTWRNFVKDGLMAVMTLSVISLSPTVTLFLRGEWKVSLSIFIAAVVLGSISSLIARYWRKRGIHITIVGPLVCLAILLVSPFLAWKLGFTLWPLLILIACILFWYTSRFFLFLSYPYQEKSGA